MSEESKKVYDPKEIEEHYYKIWETRGYFEIEGNKKIAADKTFSIMMPSAQCHRKSSYRSRTYFHTPRYYRSL